MIAQDLKAGDVFLFREKEYFCLYSVTDARHTVSSVVCMEKDSSFDQIVTIKFFRTYSIQLKKRYDLKLVKLENTKEEITDEMIAHLKLFRRKNNGT